MVTIDYRPPGVYTREGVAPSTPAPFYRPACIAILGRVTEHYLTTNGEEIKNTTPYTKSGDDWVYQLAYGRVVVTDESGAACPVLIHTVLMSHETTPTYFLENTDYTIDYETGAITFLKEGSATYPIADEDTWILITYTHLPQGQKFYAPKDFYDYDDVIGFYGDPLDADGHIQSPMVLSAGFALQNAPWVKCFPIDPHLDGTGDEIITNEDWRITIDEKLALEDVDIVVTQTEFALKDYTPLEGDSDGKAQQLYGYMDNHLSDMCSEVGRMERIWIWSDIYGLDIFSDDPYMPDMMNTATTHIWGKDREEEIYVCPPGVDWFNYRKKNPFDGTEGYGEQLDGNYLAAYLAGILAHNDPQMPLTRKKADIFHDLGDSYHPLEQNTVASKGCTVMEVKPGGLRVRHGLTCDTTRLERTEPSIVRAKHYMCKYLRARLEEAFIGQPMVSTTFMSIASMTYAMLVLLKDAGIIYDFQNVKARANPDLPTEVLVKYEYCPAYPLNYITIEFTINPKLMTSQTAEAAADKGLGGI